MGHSQTPALDVIRAFADNRTPDLPEDAAAPVWQFAVNERFAPATRVLFLWTNGFRCGLLCGIEAEGYRVEADLVLDGVGERVVVSDETPAMAVPVNLEGLRKSELASIASRCRRPEVYTGHLIKGVRRYRFPNQRNAAA